MKESYQYVPVRSDQFVSCKSSLFYDDKNPDWVSTLNLGYFVSCDPTRYEQAKLRGVKQQRLDQEMQDEEREVVEDFRETGTLCANTADSK